jgi:hypothetical protein
MHYELYTQSMVVHSVNGCTLSQWLVVCAAFTMLGDAPVSMCRALSTAAPPQEGGADPLQLWSLLNLGEGLSGIYWVRASGLLYPALPHCLEGQRWPMPCLLWEHPCVCGTRGACEASDVLILFTSAVPVLCCLPTALSMETGAQAGWPVPGGVLWQLHGSGGCGTGGRHSAACQDFERLCLYDHRSCRSVSKHKHGKQRGEGLELLGFACEASLSQCCWPCLSRRVMAWALYPWSSRSCMLLGCCAGDEHRA